MRASVTAISQRATHLLNNGYMTYGYRSDPIDIPCFKLGPYHRHSHLTVYGRFFMIRKPHSDKKKIKNKK